MIGEVRKRAELRRIQKVGIARNGKVKKAVRGKASSNIPVGMSANAFLKAMKSQAKGMDPAAQKLLKSLIKETTEVVDTK